MKNEYDLTKAEYNKNNKICVICHKKDKYGNEHGEFWITPSNLNHGHGCPKCKSEKISELKLMSKEEFIRKSINTHGSKYNYSNVEYRNSQEKVCIICPTHGKFWQIATEHIQGHGCPKCAGVSKSSTEEFINKSKQIHGNRYDYSKVEYINNRTKVCIICPVHGEFWQTPKNHLKGQGCNKCAIKYRADKLRLTKEYFINKAISIHGTKYDYSKVEYIGINDKVCIICPEHGEFWQTPSMHLNGCGCPQCANNIKLTTEQFIQRAKEMHGNKYDYSKTEYKNAQTKVCIICPVHGEFWQKPTDHLNTNGCEKCGIERRAEYRTYKLNDFITKAQETHGNKYDYSKVEYYRSNDKVRIKCPIHGEFMQTATEHIQGSGCPKCSIIQSKAEDEIVSYIKQINSNIRIIQRERTILNRKEIDIYLPDYKIGIEYDGLAWHNEKYKIDKNYHLNKTKECKNKGIRLIHIFEDEWIFKKDAVKNMLNNILGMTDKKICLSECEIKNIDVTTVNKFLNKYSLQGRCVLSYNIGLYHNNKLLSVMSSRQLSNTKKDNINENVWIITKFCTIWNVNETECASKMLNHLINTKHVDRIIVHVDKRINDGEIYNKLHFEHKKDTKPDYYYVIRQHRISKNRYTKNILFENCNDSTKTMHELMNKNGFYRIYDCGAMIFEYKVENNQNNGI
jgi:hypothetical protein